MLGLIKIISYLISIFMIAFVFVIISNGAIHAQGSSNNLKITCIANEEFLLSSSTKNILIDALFEGYGLFAVSSQETINSIMNDKTLFSKEAYNNTNAHFIRQGRGMVRNNGAIKIET